MTDAFELPLSLVQALAQRAAQTPERIALRFLADTPGEQAVLSYRDLDQRARTIAAALQGRASFGDRAVLLFPSGPDYVAAFFGCLYAGVIAVPAYPPESARQQHQERLLSIIDDAEPRLLLTVAALRDSLQGLEALAADNAPNCWQWMAWTRPWLRTGVNPCSRAMTSPSCSTPPVPPRCPRACRSAMATWWPTSN